MVMASILYAGLQQTWVYVVLGAPQTAETHPALVTLLDLAFVLVFVVSSTAAGLGDDRWVRGTIVVVGGSFLLAEGLGSVAGYLFQRQAMAMDVGLLSQLGHGSPLIIAAAVVATLVGLGPAWLGHRLRRRRAAV